ncbi:MAG: tetratricopeptide repeat protein [Bacteroidota bacterium]
MGYKVIIAGQLDFHNARSYEKTIEMCKHKMEVLYKERVLLKIEDIFDEEQCSIIIPRFVKEEVEMKRWRNTLSLINYIAEFAMSGSVSAWRVESGKVLEHEVIEPTSDKTAIRAYMKGRQMMDEEGRMEEAKQALDKAIKKFERHALAYERRGYINFLLKNYDDAVYDYTKSISLYGHNAKPYYGRAMIKIIQKDLAGAIEDLDKAIKTSIALEPIYWRSRKIKGECHIELEEYSKAEFEFKLFTKRNFAEADPNRQALKDAYFSFGKTLLEVGKPTEALKALDTAKTLKEGKESFSEEEWKTYHQQAVEAVA